MELDKSGIPVKIEPFVQNYPKEITSFVAIPTTLSVLYTTPSEIILYNLEKKTQKILFKRRRRPSKIQIDIVSRMFFWVEEGPQETSYVAIYRSNLFMGRTRRLTIPIYEGNKEPKGISHLALINQEIYFVLNNYMIYRTNFEGETSSLVYKEQHGQIRTFVIHNTLLYFSTESFIIQLCLVTGDTSIIDFDSTRRSLTTASTAYKINDKNYLYYSNRVIDVKENRASRVDIQPQGERMQQFTIKLPNEGAINSITFVPADSPCKNNTCYTMGGVCVVKMQTGCDCFAGWKGTDCQECDSSVLCHGNGYCSDIDGTCTCKQGYNGTNCNVPMCFGIRADDPKACSSNGDCVDVDTCQCQPYHTGERCELPICFGRNSTDPNVCSSFGNCIGPNECKCNKGHYGAMCEKFFCFGKNQTDQSGCSYNGFCTSSDLCWCDFGYYGKQCENWKCFDFNRTDLDACNSNGYCTAPDTCTCKEGWSGINCKDPVCFGKNATDPEVCGSRGKCLRPDLCVCSQSKTMFQNCTCHPGYIGKDCTNFECFGVSNNDQSVCSKHGSCTSMNQCSCSFGYAGDVCDFNYLYFIIIPIVAFILMGIASCLAFIIWYWKNSKSRPEEYVRLIDSKFSEYITKEQNDLGRNLQIDYNELQFLDQVDEGGFSVVFKGKWQGHLVAIKYMKDYILGDDPKQWQTLLAEVKILSTLHHPNIITFWGLCIHGKDKYIITEFVEGHNLHKALSSKMITKTADKIQILKQIVTGMKYLHTRNPPIIHRDLKTKNVLIEGTNAKICDFGLSKTLSETSQNTQMVGSLETIAPECMEENPVYNEKCDVYSFGILMYEMMFGSPFQEVHFKMSLLISVPKGKRPIIQDEWRKDYKEYIELMEDCWEGDPLKRPSFSKILKRLQKLDHSTPKIISESVKEIYNLNNSLNF